MCPVGLEELLQCIGVEHGVDVLHRLPLLGTEEHPQRIVKTATGKRCQSPDIRFGGEVEHLTTEPERERCLFLALGEDGIEVVSDVAHEPDTVARYLYAFTPSVSGNVVRVTG